MIVLLPPDALVFLVAPSAVNMAAGQKSKRRQTMEKQEPQSSRPAVRYLSALIMLLGAGAANADRCSNLIQAFGNQLADVSCVDSADLTTANTATTPANSARPPPA